MNECMYVCMYVFMNLYRLRVVKIVGGYQIHGDYLLWGE